MISYIKIHYYITVLYWRDHFIGLFIARDHCSPNPCENGASCQNQWDGFFCFCPPGWTGHRCEQSGESLILAALSGSIFLFTILVLL